MDAPSRHPGADARPHAPAGQRTDGAGLRAACAVGLGPGSWPWQAACRDHALAARRLDARAAACCVVMPLARWWRERRDERVMRRRAIPDVLWRLTLARYPFLSMRSETEQAELRTLATLFLARKEFSGAQGFVVTDAIAVAVAAQACLPILRIGLHAYDGFVGIVMHGTEVVVEREVMDE